MKIWTRFGLVALVLVGLGMLLLHGTSRAGDEEKHKKEVDAIAAAIKGGKMEVATDLSKKLAKKEKDDGVYNIMMLMKPRDKKGFGVGKAGDITPDGIEQKVLGMARDLISAKKMSKEKDALDEMAFRIAAIGEFAEALPPTKDKGKKTKKKWMEYAKTMHEAALDLHKAIQSDSPAELKKAATRVNDNCAGCHNIFK